MRGWTRAYRRWLTTIRFDHPAQQLVLQVNIHADQDPKVRVQRRSARSRSSYLRPAAPLRPLAEYEAAASGGYRLSSIPL